jgi:hypothetical protein
MSGRRIVVTGKWSCKDCGKFNLDILIKSLVNYYLESTIGFFTKNKTKDYRSGYICGCCGRTQVYSSFSKLKSSLSRAFPYLYLVIYYLLINHWNFSAGLSVIVLFVSAPFFYWIFFIRIN